MQHVLVPSDALTSAAPFPLHDEESRHLRTVLRVRDGDAVCLLDGMGHRRPATVRVAGRQGVMCEPCGLVEALRRPPVSLTLFQCVAKPTRMDWLVEKAAELGVSTLVPVLSARTVVRMGEGGRPDRWRRIAESALRQSGGGWMMRVEPPHGWGEALDRMRAFSGPLLVGALTATAKPLGDVLTAMRETAPAAVGWLIGPEGDFTPDELESALGIGQAVPVSLGHQVLRVETAALYGVSATLAMMKDEGV